MYIKFLKSFRLTREYHLLNQIGIWILRFCYNSAIIAGSKSSFSCVQRLKFDRRSIDSFDQIQKKRTLSEMSINIKLLNVMLIDSVSNLIRTI